MCQCFFNDVVELFVKWGVIEEGIELVCQGQGRRQGFWAT
jgi:hypothetical protein